MPVRHWRFFAALLFGLAIFLVAQFLDVPAPLLAGGDAFFLLFLVLSWWLCARQSAHDLKSNAHGEDEGIIIVMLIAMAALGFFAAAVFEALNRRHGLQVVPLALAGVGAPLGWLVLHTVMAFHYADLHYYDDPRTHADDVPALKFPHTARPDPGDFLYFSFVIGMTAQVSDVQVQTGRMRRAVLFHGVASFFFNTVFIAMAVNAGVAMAS